LGGRAISFESLAVHIGKVAGDADDHAFMKQAQAFCKSLKWKMGLSNDFKSLAGLGNAYLQGKMALREGQQRRGDDSVFRFGDFRVDFICTELLKQVDTPYLISRDIINIAAYDEENGTNLLDTLEAYLRNERSMTKTSNCLFLHRNSVAYRIEKVKALLRCDLDNPETRAGLQLSLKIWRRLHAPA
ncbi:MAG: helix-turn-helix domain-containing protein, partial [Coriobacteriales bacterium]|nr:helix-turn-helix domain-containing protein [Coriobacteriales bacterium]